MCSNTPVEQGRPLKVTPETPQIKLQTDYCHFCRIQTVASLTLLLPVSDSDFEAFTS